MEPFAALYQSSLVRRNRLLQNLYKSLAYGKNVLIKQTVTSLWLSVTFQTQIVIHLVDIIHIILLFDYFIISR